MIGTSLSFCVRNLVDNRSDISKVNKIISSTAFTNDEEFEIVVNQYCKTYWSKHPWLYSRVAYYLKDKGLIDQPRLTCNKVPRAPSQLWLNDESELELVEA